MAKQLTIDEMLDAARESEMPGTEHWTSIMEAQGTLLAMALATHLGVIAGSATNEGADLGGTCAPFFPKFKGQPCPEVLKKFDYPEWEMDDDESCNT